MSTMLSNKPTLTVDVILKQAWWGDFQKPNGAWSHGISNKTELIEQLTTLLASIIGEPVVKGSYGEHPSITLVREQRQRAKDAGFDL